MKRVLVFAAVLALGAVGLFVYHHHGPREVPRGQPPLESLEPGLSSLRRAFNDAQDETRIVAMLSPTWPVCVRGASALDDVLSEVPRLEARVLVVWEPVIQTDVGPPMDGVLARLDDARARQYWDPKKRLSSAMLAAFRRNPARAPSPGCSPDDDVVWDVVAVHSPGAKWTDGAPPPPAFAGTPVVQSLDGLRRHLRTSSE